MQKAFSLLRAELDAHPVPGVFAETIDITKASDAALPALALCEEMAGIWGVEILSLLLTSINVRDLNSGDLGPTFFSSFCQTVALSLDGRTDGYYLAQWYASSPSLFLRRKERLARYMRELSPRDAADVLWPHADIDDSATGPVLDAAFIKAAADEWAEAIEATLKIEM